MLKFVFWALLAANAGMLAHGQGLLGQGTGAEREPARLQNQLARDKLVQLSAVQAKAAADSAAAEQEPAPEASAAPEPAAPLAPQLATCVQAGPFSTADARRFEARLAALALGERQSRIDIPFQEVTSRLVYLPPAGGREGAQKRAAELKERGVTNFFIMQGDSPLRHAVSLGVFKSDGAAQKLVADLQKKGVRGVRVLPRGPQGTRPGYQFRGLEPELRLRLAGIADDYAGGTLRDCD